MRTNPAGNARDLTVVVALLGQLLRDTFLADLVDFVDRDQYVGMSLRRNRYLGQPRGNELAMVDANHEIVEPQRRQDLRHGRDLFGFHDRRGRPDAVDIALIELPKAASGRAVGAPYGLNLITLEEPRQLGLVLSDHSRERDRQVVAEREIGLPARLVLTALEDLEDQLVAFVAVLAEERLD